MSLLLTSLTEPPREEGREGISRSEARQWVIKAPFQLRHQSLLLAESGRVRRSENPSCPLCNGDGGPSRKLTVREEILGLRCECLPYH